MCLHAMTFESQRLLTRKPKKKIKKSRTQGVARRGFLLERLPGDPSSRANLRDLQFLALEIGLEKKHQLSESLAEVTIIY